MVDEEEATWPRFDATKFGQTIRELIAETLNELRILGITQTRYWAIPETPKGIARFSVHVPNDQFPWSRDVDADHMEFEHFDAELKILGGKVTLKTEVSYQALLGSQKIRMAISQQTLGKLIRWLQKDYEETCQTINHEYGNQKEMIAWRLAAPDLQRMRETICKLEELSSTIEVGGKSGRDPC